MAAAKEPAKLPSLLTLLTSSAKQVEPGTSVTLCYGVEEVTEVAVDPPVHELRPVSSCFTVVLEKTTTFRVTATGEGGRKETKELTVSVN
ncbi:MAG: hypothetical protein GY953_53115 [bacterium]|nr:hypothetical protein [bacterium]